MDFNPSGVGQRNGNFIGLPFDQTTAQLILQPVPWEVTVSYGGGTARGPDNILHASAQLDLYLPEAPDTWKVGIWFRPTDPQLLQQSDHLRALATDYIAFIENGGQVQHHPHQARLLDQINTACHNTRQWVYHQTRQLLQQGKAVGLIGGDHSTPLGFLEALAERHPTFGVLQIDAHCDLRQAYEGFTYSHASIYYNALQQIPAISRLVQVGIRDYCHEEAEYAQQSQGRIHIHTDHSLRQHLFAGHTYHQWCQQIISSLPQHVYISFDIDGLDPSLCPGTGTPVAGGFSFAEATYLLQQIANSGRTVIGFDLCEVGSSSEWDGNVGARTLYQLCSTLARSQQLLPVV